MSKKNNFGTGVNDAIIAGIMATATTVLGTVVTYGLKKAAEAFSNSKGGK